MATGTRNRNLTLINRILEQLMPNRPICSGANAFGGNGDLLDFADWGLDFILQYYDVCLKACASPIHCCVDHYTEQLK